MSAEKFFTGVILSAILTVTSGELRFSRHLRISRDPLFRISTEPRSDMLFSINGPKILTTEVPPTIFTNYRERREGNSTAAFVSSDKQESNFDDDDEIGWTNINEEVDMVIPKVVGHLQSLGIEHLRLPDMNESISVSLVLITYEAGLFLNNGIVYDISGIQRYGNAFMTYEGKSFVCRFYLILKSLQFEYNFLIKLMPLEGFGKVIGSLDDTVIFSELAVNVADSKLKLNDFRIVQFGNIRVQLDQMRIIRQLSGAFLSPITNLFRDRITTSISDGLKDQMQLIMDDFDENDPLELRKFTKQILASLIGRGDE